MLTRLVPVLFMSFITVSGYAAPVSGTLPQYQQPEAQVDARIQKLRVGGVPAVYTDSANQLSWSKKLQGTYTNGCVDAYGDYDESKCTFEELPDGSLQVKVDDSAAAIACKKIGGRLPTKSEFESLIRNFDHTDERAGPKLTPKGRAAFQTVFGDMDNMFWTSSVKLNDPYGTYYLHSAGTVAFDHSRAYDYAVLCVDGRFAAPVSGTLPQYQQPEAQVDARIQKLRAGGVPAVYTDSTNQLSWSKKLLGTYSNGCVNANDRPDGSKCTFETLPDGSRQVKVDNSNAAIACKKIGGRLPTKSEYESLIRNFDHTEESGGPQLTGKGRVAMQKVFGDMDFAFWTRSMKRGEVDDAYVFNSHYADVHFDIWRDYKYAVRCVVGR